MNHTKNGIPQINSTYRRQLVCHTSETILRELREMAARTGMSQRSIIENGIKRQLRELQRQIDKGQLPVIDGDIENEAS